MSLADHSLPASRLSPEEEELLARLTAGEVAAFEYVFNAYYQMLCRQALRYVRVEQVAEELVDDVLTTLWQKRQTIQITRSLSAYLLTAIRNTSLNYLKSQYARQQFLSDATEFTHPSLWEEPLTQQELEAIVQAGIDALPPACRAIFHLSRQADLSYEEIAQELGLSKKTVKAQMGIALKKLRHYLGQHWGKLLLFDFFIFF